MTSLKSSSIAPTGGVQDRPALSFTERCAIADREIGYVVEKIAAVRDMLNREDNPTGRELLGQTIDSLSNTLHELRGRQTILRNIHPVLKQKMAEMA